MLEVTGLESNSRVVQLICQTFEALKKLADFDAPSRVDKDAGDEQEEPLEEERSQGRERRSGRSSSSTMGLNLSYTINLVLPKSDDPAVFTAIFKSLRDTLLRS